jgi:CubicO group peptidase (beta-lactamase class C family)
MAGGLSQMLNRFVPIALSTIAMTGSWGCESIRGSIGLHPESIDAIVNQAMAGTTAKGMAVAVTQDGAVVFSKAYGTRNAKADPLTSQTVMYGASLTKAVFAVLVMQLVEEDKISLDQPLATYLPRPLPSYNSDADARAYAPWAGLEGDERWRKITARMVLNHSTGFANFAFLEPDGKLRMHFDPGSRYAYSGAGIMLLQFVLERGLGLNVGTELQSRIFDKAGMPNTSLKWRTDFAANLADGFKEDGSVEPHDERSRVRAAGSMDTTIADYAAFSAALMSGKLISPTSLSELTRSTLPIRSRSQFPSLLPEPDRAAFPSISAGLGVIAFDGPQGKGFYKGGHNDSTGNTWVCLSATRRCVVILSNDVRAERAFPAIVRTVLGETGAPWEWEYSGMSFWKPQ